jgi:hypothetical protein
VICTPIGVAMVPVAVLLGMLLLGVHPAWAATCTGVVWFAAVLAILVMADREART